MLQRDSLNTFILFSPRFHFERENSRKRIIGNNFLIKFLFMPREGERSGNKKQNRTEQRKINRKNFGTIILNWTWRCRKLIEANHISAFHRTNAFAACFLFFPRSPSSTARMGENRDRNYCPKITDSNDYYCSFFYIFVISFVAL